MKLFGGLLSPYVMRAALAARLKGHDIPVTMPDGGIKTAAYRALNPLGKMPTLVDGGFALPESAVIAEYLEEALDGPTLLPGGPADRARARLVARIADLYFAPHLTAIFRSRENPAAVPPAIERLGETLAILEGMADPHGPWLLGDAPGLADATLMPLLFFLDAFHSAHGTGRLIDAAVRPRLARWWAHARASSHGERMVREMAEGLARFTPRPAPAA